MVTGFIHPYLAQINDLVTGEVLTEHITRLKVYNPPLRGSGWTGAASELREQAASDADAYLVESCTAFRVVEGSLQILVKWRGFPDDLSTWEDAAKMLDEAADVVGSALFVLLEEDGDSDIKAAAKTLVQ